MLGVGWPLSVGVLHKLFVGLAFLELSPKDVFSWVFALLLELCGLVVAVCDFPDFGIEVVQARLDGGRIAFRSLIVDVRPFASAARIASSSLLIACCPRRRRALSG